MEEKRLKYRMYFFTVYSLSPIQQAIQAGHAALEYAHTYNNHNDFIDFINNDKTWIILNGGTTNSSRELGTGFVQGTLDQIADFLKEKEIKFSFFNEPDLNDALTAVCFLADERIWDFENYPDFANYILNIIYPRNEHVSSAQTIVEIRMKTIEELQEMFPEYYKEWFDFIGGEKNIFLRELLKGKKLA